MNIAKTQAVRQQEVQRILMKRSKRDSLFRMWVLKRNGEKQVFYSYDFNTERRKALHSAHRPNEFNGFNQLIKLAEKIHNKDGVEVAIIYHNQHPSRPMLADIRKDFFQPKLNGNQKKDLLEQLEKQKAKLWTDYQQLLEHGAPDEKLDALMEEYEKINLQIDDITA
ncbi:hypothetical protein V6R21_07620 [Limibacter armeniacum]|uniref:hypothetical protein n=1 Tax=Limibacter armeniacum TaxID=466084 RepID=UPI002FE6AB0B